jgi:hypothetical protein
MNTEPRKQLHKLYLQKVEKAIRDAQAGAPADELKTDIEQISNYAKLLELTRGEFTLEAGFAIIAAVICLLVAGYLWSHRLSHNSIALSAETSTLQGEVKEQWQLDSPFRSPLVHLERLNRISVPNLGVNINDADGDAWVRIEGGQINSQSLEVDPGAVVAISADTTEASLFISRKPMRGKLTLVGKGTITAGAVPGQVSTRRSYDLDVPETVEFEVRDPGAVASRLTFHDPQKWSLGRAPFGNLNFALEEVRDVENTNFVSGIKSGTLTFNQTSWPPQPISEKDMLAVHDTRQSDIQIGAGDQRIHVTLNGIVQGVSLGQGDAKRLLGPSLLEYFYSQKTISFFWGAVVFIWSMIWGIRRAIFR